MYIYVLHLYISGQTAPPALQRIANIYFHNPTQPPTNPLQSTFLLTRLPLVLHHPSQATSFLLGPLASGMPLHTPP